MKTAYFLLVTALLAGAVVATPQSEPAKQNEVRNESQGATSEAVFDPDTQYVIGPEDVLSINVWREPELSASVPVRPDGKISLALLNDVQAAGLSPMQLKMQITRALKKYVSEPVVTVVVTNIHSQRIFLVGEVTHAGPVPLLPKMTVLQAIASGGGLTPFANTKKIYVLRNDNGTQVKHKFNYRNALKNPGAENIPLKSGDTIVVP